MASGATEWAWRQSRAKNGSLIVLLAIADEIDNGREAVMSVANLAAKAHLSERAAQAAVSDLGRLGLMSAARVKGGLAYRLAMVDHMPEAADSAPLPASRGADSAPRRICTPQNLHPASAVAVTVEPQVKPGYTVDRASEHAESAPRQISNVLELGSVVSGGKSRSREESEAPRDDVRRLCEHLADRIAANGSKRPVAGKKWHDAARLLIDKDGRTEQQVMAAIDWCQDDEFWRANILSMPKLREKYDRLRLDAIRKKSPAASRPDRQQQRNDRFARAAMRIKAREESGNDPDGNGHPSALHRIALPPAAH